jgi:3'-phosphoadenosine 5'-phosphosulfate sulfotransferase (PAPS reductase)/FAD synthetase
LWLAKKAFFGHVPFELIHIDTNYKIPEMIAYRDRLAKEIKLRLVVGQNKKALAEKKPFPTAWTGFRCCKELKTIPQNRIRPQNPCADPSPFGVDGTEYLGIYRAGKNPHHSHLL